MTLIIIMLVFMAKPYLKSVEFKFNQNTLVKNKFNQNLLFLVVKVKKRK